MSYNSTYSPLDTQKLNERVTVLENGGDLSDYWTSAETSTFVAGELADYTPTSGFSTINGSAITSGGNITIQGGGGASPIYVDKYNEELEPNFEIAFNLKKAEVESGATNPDLEHRVVYKHDNMTVPVTNIFTNMLEEAPGGLESMVFVFVFSDEYSVYNQSFRCYYSSDGGEEEFVVTQETQLSLSFPQDEEGGEA